MHELDEQAGPTGWQMDAEYPAIAVYDIDGTAHDLAWLEDVWGMALDIRRAVPGDAEYVMRVVELRFHEGPCVQIVSARGLDGEPYRTAIGRWWAGAPGLNPYPSDCIATRWHNNAIIGWTDGGVVGFGMGSGDMPGSSGVWPVHCQAPSDYVGNLGWLPGTNHKSIDVTFQLFKVGDEPGPTPPPEEGEDYYLMIPVRLVKR